MASYQRTVSSDDGRGFKYESKMTAFAALRLYAYTDDFYLANNFNSGEKFDDLVYTYKVNNLWNTHFVQLKHKQVSLKKKVTLAMLRTKGADFTIPKYFESYKKIFKKFNLQSSNVIFQRNYVGARFLIFTNALLHEEVTQRGLKQIDCGLLSTNAPSELNFSLDVEKDADILDGMVDDPQIKDFVKKFYFCSGQASEQDMDGAILNEVKKIMEKVAPVSESDLKYISLQFCAALYSWYANGKYLTKDDVNRILMDLSVASQCGKKNATALSFTPKFGTFILDVLSQDKVICLESKAETSIMCMAQLKQLGLTEEPNKLMELQQLQVNQFQEHLMAISNPEQVTLIIDCDADRLAIRKEELAIFLKKLFHVQPAMSIVFVTVVGNAVALALMTDLKIKRRKYNCTMMQLTEESKRKIMSSEMIFQGYNAPLSMLLKSPNNKAFDDVINMSVMTQLLLGRKLEVGVRPIEQIPYYVPRVLTRFAAIAPTVFTDPRIHECFILSGLSFEDVISKVPFIASGITTKDDPQWYEKKYVVIEETADVQFEQMAMQTKRPLHWLNKGKKSGNVWSWKASSKNLSYLAQHIDRSNRFCDYVPTDNIMDIKDRVMVIIAEPGMGKSTLLVHLALETKRSNPEMWVVTLVMNDFTKQYDDPKFLTDIKASTKNLIALAAGVSDKETSKLNLRLFNQCYDVSGNMIVLLDGFDEITPYYTKHGLAIIDALRESAVSRVWVTARPVICDLLENATLCFSYTIKPFETKDQINFLKKYWQHAFTMIDPKKLEIYIKTVLEMVDRSFDERLNQFTGIPLQTRMLAEVFQQGLLTYHKTGQIVLKERINGVELFEEFVRIKRGIQMEKAKITVTNAIAIYEQKMLNDVREQELMRLALVTLLPRNACAKLVPSISNDMINTLKDMVHDGNEKSGIVVSFNGETPQFIHRTFAEYFVALFFARNFSSNREFLNSELFSDKNFDFVRYFFDRILSAGCKLHDAVLERQQHELERLLSEEGTSVDGKDSGGRTALHVAASMPGNEFAIKMLLRAGANAELVDDVFQLTPLNHAWKCRDVSNAAPLLELSSINNLPLTALPITSENLLVAVRGDYFRMFLHLLNNGIYGVENLDELSRRKWFDDTEPGQLTILHVAAAHNAVEILKYLLRKDSRDSKLRLLDLADSEGRTPMMLAAERGSVEALAVILDAGCNSQSGTGKGLLEWAVQRKDLKLLESAIKDAVARKIPLDEYFGPVITKVVSDKSKWTVLADPIIRVWPNLVNYITPKGIPMIALAAMKNNVSAVQKLCKMGADVNAGYPLHIAASKDYDSVVKELLTVPQIDLNAVNAEGFPPLYVATLNNALKVFQMLVDAGADLGCVTSDGSDLTHAIGSSCNEMLFFYLLEKKFDFKKSNSCGATGLSLLKDNGAISLVRLLDPSFEPLPVPKSEKKQVSAVTQPPKAVVVPQKQNPPKVGKKQAAVQPQSQPQPTADNVVNFLQLARDMYGGDFAVLAEKLRSYWGSTTGDTPSDSPPVVATTGTTLKKKQKQKKKKGPSQPQKTSIPPQNIPPLMRNPQMGSSQNLSGHFREPFHQQPISPSGPLMGSSQNLSGHFREPFHQQPTSPGGPRFFDQPPNGPPFFGGPPHPGGPQFFDQRPNSNPFFGGPPQPNNYMQGPPAFMGGPPQSNNYMQGGANLIKPLQLHPLLPPSGTGPMSNSLQQPKKKASGPKPQKNTNPPQQPKKKPSGPNPQQQPKKKTSGNNQNQKPANDKPQ